MAAVDAAVALGRRPTPTGSASAAGATAASSPTGRSIGPPASRPRPRAPASPTRSRATAPTTTSGNTRPSSGCPGRTPRPGSRSRSRSWRRTRSRRPTLFLCGEVDWNVPLIHSEQMYQALRRPRRAHRARRLSGREPQHPRADLPEGPARALPGLVRQVPEARAGRGRRAARSDLVPGPAARLPPARRDEQKKTLEENLAKATADYAEDPENAGRLIWVGRRLGYLGRYREAIAIFSRGVAEVPRGRPLPALPRPPLHHGARARQGDGRPPEGRRAHPCEGL